MPQHRVFARRIQQHGGGFCGFVLGAQLLHSPAINRSFLNRLRRIHARAHHQTHRPHGIHRIFIIRFRRGLLHQNHQLQRRRCNGVFPLIQRMGEHGRALAQRMVKQQRLNKLMARIRHGFIAVITQNGVGDPVRKLIGHASGQISATINPQNTRRGMVHFREPPTLRQAGR